MNARVDAVIPVDLKQEVVPPAQGVVPLPASPQTLVLAGGGNRCWWQAGLLSTLMKEGATLPRELIGTSAGAAIATALMSGGVSAALDACRRLYSGNAAVFRWRGLLSGRFEFAHQCIYPAWLAAFVDAASLQRLHLGSSRLLVAVSRPTPVMGLAASVGLGTLAYVWDNKLQHSLHPRLPHWLGLRLDFLALHECESSAEAARLLCAAAAPPPILPAQRLGGRLAFDGGYTDNAPMPKRSAAELSRSLTLLTRHYPERPEIFRAGHRWYWQPSRPVPISTWDCTLRTTPDAAFELGRVDAHAWLARCSG
jgi:hypothetical protein